MFVEIEAIGNKYIQIVLLISWNFELFTSQKNFSFFFKVDATSNYDDDEDDQKDNDI